MEDREPWSFGRVIVRYRKKQHINQTEFARLMGTARNTVANWETDRSRPEIETIRRICLQLDIPIQELMNLPDRLQLTSDEFTLIENYRSLTASGRETASFLVRALTQKESEDEEVSLRRDYRLLELHGSPVAAGTGAVFGDAPPQPFFVKNTSCSTRADAIVRVSGKSMEPIYHDGDLLYVKYGSEALDGDDVICSTADGAVVKRVRGNTLYSVNSDYPFGDKSEDDHVTILGRVLGVVGEGDVPTKEQTARLEQIMKNELRRFEEK